MELHEYQAKKILKAHQLPVQPSFLINNLNDLKSLKNHPFIKSVAKCQVHLGGRGKAGGVKLLENYTELESFCHKWLGNYLTTYQSNKGGKKVSSILIEEAAVIRKEFYLAFTLDRQNNSLVAIASQDGGVDIETLAKNHPQKILKTKIDISIGAQSFQARRIAKFLNLNKILTSEFINIFLKLADIYTKYDLSMLEINPLVIDSNDKLLCADAKFSIDNNAKFRQKNIFNMRDESQEDIREIEAHKYDLSYISLDGEIGCMVNGAGLAMATMDTIKSCGGNPANFLDVGGSATEDKVAKAFEIILKDQKIKVILINIFGGIVRCDLIANGIIKAISNIDVKVPVVVRLEGNNAPSGKNILAESGLNILTCDSLLQAAQKSTQMSQEKVL